jgi:LmbE family N-acetylglucosaminyl deacetylase
VRRFPGARRAGAAGVAFLLAVAAVAASPPHPLAVTLRRVESTARVLVVVAHPGDEHPGVVAALSLGRGARVTVLALTRGERAHGAAGSEAADVLRLATTRASLEALGAELLVGRAPDVTAATAEGVVTAWGEPALADLVRALRQVRPDVILAGDGEDHAAAAVHAAAARLARDAVPVAADPRRYPETGPVWRTTKLYARDEGGAAWVLTSPVDPLWGSSWQELGVARRPGPRPAPDPRYVRLLPATTPPEADPLDGVPVRLVGLLRLALEEPGVARSLGPGLDTLDARVAAAGAAADPSEPPRAVPALRTLLEAVRHWRGRALGMAPSPAATEIGARLEAQERDVERALAQAQQLDLQARADDATLVPGQTVGVTVSLRNGGRLPVEVVRLEIATRPGWRVSGGLSPGLTLPEGGTASARVLVSVPADAAATSGTARTGLDALPSPEMVARLQYATGGVGARLEAPVRGEGGAVQVVPALALAWPAPVTLGPSGSTDVEVVLFDHSPAGGPARIRLLAPAGWKVEPAETLTTLAGSGSMGRVRFRLTAPAKARDAARIGVEVTRGAARSTEAVRVVDVPGGAWRLYGPAVIVAQPPPVPTRKD